MVFSTEVGGTEVVFSEVRCIILYNRAKFLLLVMKLSSPAGPIPYSFRPGSLTLGLFGGE